MQIMRVDGKDVVSEGMWQEIRRRHVNGRKRSVEPVASRSIRRSRKLVLVTSAVGLSSMVGCVKARAQALTF